MATSNTPPEPGAEATPRGGSRVAGYIRRHTRGVIVGLVMGLGVMAIAGGGLGGYVKYIKQKAPPAVQGSALTEGPALVVGAAETAARVVVGGPGSGPAPAPESGTQASPNVWFQSAAYSGSEGDTVTVYLASGDHPDKSFTVSVKFLDGTADKDADLEAKEWTVTFPGGVNLVGFEVDITADDVQESAETAKLAIYSGTGYNVGSPSETILTIAADPAPSASIHFNPTHYTVTEGANPWVSITVKRTDDSTHRVPFIITPLGSRPDYLPPYENPDRKEYFATANVDFWGMVQHGAIPANATSTIMTIPILDDNKAERHESFYVLLDLPEGSSDELPAHRSSGRDSLISIVDADVVDLTLKEDFLKVGEDGHPQWQYQTARLTPQFSREFDYPIEITCRADDVAFEPAVLRIEPEDWDDPPHITVSAIKDGDFEYEKDEIDCELTRAEAIVNVTNIHEVPVFIYDEGTGRLPTEDENGNRIRSFMVTGDMAQGGLDQYPTVHIDAKSAQDGPHTFTLSAYAVDVNTNNAHVCEQMVAPSSVTIPKGAMNKSVTVKMPKDGKGAVCGLTATPTGATSWATDQGVSSKGRGLYIVDWAHQRE